jgi:hypothetical protein
MDNTIISVKESLFMPPMSKQETSMHIIVPYLLIP